MTFLIRYWLREPFARNGTCFGHLFLFWVPEAHSPLQEWGLEAFGMSPCLVEVALDSPFWRTEVRRRLRAFFNDSYSQPSPLLPHMGSAKLPVIFPTGRHISMELSALMKISASVLSNMEATSQVPLLSTQNVARVAKELKF